jgi:hypothetical protein
MKRLLNGMVLATVVAISAVPAWARARPYGPTDFMAGQLNRAELARLGVGMLPGAAMPIPDEAIPYITYPGPRPSGHVHPYPGYFTGPDR